MKYTLSVHNNDIFTTHKKLGILGYHVIFYTANADNRHIFKIHLHNEEQLLALMLQIPCQLHLERHLLT
jgi:hypothetical protein